MIYGVKAGGVGLAKSIRNQVDSRYVVSGFVSDRQDMQGRFLMGKRVYSNDEHLVEKMEDFGVHTLLVSPLKNEAIRNNPEIGLFYTSDDADDTQCVKRGVCRSHKLHMRHRHTCV